MVGAFTQGFWRRLCLAVDRPEWPEDPRFETNAKRLENRSVLAPMLEDIFRTRTREQWLDTLKVADVPASPVLELHEAVASEQAQYNQIVQDVGRDGIACPTARFPVRSSSWPLAESQTPPRIGEHSVDVLQDVLGKGEEEIDRLLSTGAVGVDRVDVSS